MRTRAVTPGRFGRLARWRLFALAFALAWVGCAPSRDPGYARALARADRARAAGRSAEAVPLYDAAAEAATSPGERAFAREGAIRALERSGNVEEATRRLAALAAEQPTTAASIAAQHRLAVLEIEHGDADAGYAALDRFLRRHPESGLARSALRRVLLRKDEVSAREALAYAEARASELERTALGESLAYAVAVRLRALGERERALAAFVSTADLWPYPTGALWDDALFAASELEEELGRPERAVAHLERMVREHERSAFLGTYQRPKYVPAMLRIADIHERRGDLALARRALRRLYDEYPKSTARDDALFREAELFVREGDTESACDRLAVLTREFPESRYAGCAAMVCGAAPRGRSGPAARPARACPESRKPRLD